MAGASRGLRWDAGADDVDAVQGGLGVDLCLVAAPADGRLPDVEGEVLADLVLAQRPVGLDADLVGVAEPPGIDLAFDLGQEGLGGGQQVLALASALLGQQRVAAGHQPLPGVVRAGDLDQVLLVEQAKLQRAAVLGQLLDGGGAQRSDPSHAGGGAQVTDPRRGDHPPVAHQDQPLQLKAATHHLDGLGERHRVGGVARKHPHRHRAASGIAQQPVLDLRLAALAIAGVPERRQLVVGAFHPRAGQVEHRNAVGLQVPAGQLALDLVLAVHQPVHRGVHLVGGCPRHPKVGAEGDVIPPADGGQLGARPDHP